MKHVIPIILFIFLVGCSESNNLKSVEDNDSLQPKTVLSNIDTTTIKKKEIETLNYTDSNGLKQGKWIAKWEGKIVYVKHFKDNLLHGYFGYYLDGNILAYDGNYINGKREGMFYSYSDYKEKTLMMETFFKNGLEIWTGFPEYLLVPVKGFNIKKDTVFIQAPDGFGNIWYEGSFCLQYNRYNKRKMTNAYGIHKVYFKNKKLKGIVDYDKQTILEFDTNVTKLYKAKFSEYKIHQQTMAGPY